MSKVNNKSERLEGYLGQFSVQAQKIKKNNKKKTTLKKFNTYFFLKKNSYILGNGTF